VRKNKLLSERITVILIFSYRKMYNKYLIDDLVDSFGMCISVYSSVPQVNILSSAALGL